jgi:hypothetical protein
MSQRPSKRYTKLSAAGRLVDFWFQHHLDDRAKNAVTHMARRQLVGLIQTEVHRQVRTRLANTERTAP